MDGLTLRKQRNPFVLLSKPCLYPWLTQLSLIAARSQVAEFSSMPAGEGEQEGSRAPPCFYGNTAALLGATLGTAAILFSDDPTQSWPGKSSSQGEECKQPPLSRGGSSPHCSQPPRQPPQPFIKSRAIPFACRSVLFPLPFSRERFRIHLPV